MSNYRFYYSSKQQEIAQDLNPGHHCFVFNGKEWVEYTELCSLPDSKCNWEDAILIYECDEFPEIHVEGSTTAFWDDPMNDSPWPDEYDYSKEEW